MLTKISSRRADAPSDLVALLLECHERIRGFIELAHRVGTRLDPPDREIIEACQRIERYFTQALPLHVADEEESIQPRLRGRDPDVDRALQTMQEQHARHEPKLDELLHASAEVRQMPRDERQRASLARVAADLQQELEEHLRLEEAVLFPAIRSFLSGDAQVEVVQELRRRRAVLHAPTPDLPPIRGAAFRRTPRS